VFDSISLVVMGNCHLLGGMEQKGFICIFCCAEKSCFADIQLAAAKLPPAAWILFSNSFCRLKNRTPLWGVLFFVSLAHFRCFFFQPYCNE